MAKRPKELISRSDRDHHVPGPCPYCATPMRNTGAPIWEDYCPNEGCSGHREEFKAQLRSRSFALGRTQRLEDAAPDMLAALRECQAALASIISPETIQQTTVINAFAQAAAAEVKARAAIAKAVGRP